MLIYLYLFGLIVGGVLLGASLLLGAHGHDGGELGDGEVGGDADHDVGTDTSDVLVDGESVGFLLWRFRSIRFWTFFLAFFGLTGMVLDGLGVVPWPYVTFAVALGMGSLAGFGATEVIRRLSDDGSGVAADVHDYVGKTVRVIVPVTPGGVGKVRLQLKGSTVDVLAESVEGEFAAQEEALIVEMIGTKARIARVDVRAAAGS